MSYYLALVAGAISVVSFAWTQFNRPSYGSAGELARFVETLTPSRLRKRTVFWRAYAAYAGILLLIYFTLCAYGLVLAPLLGVEIPGYTTAGGALIGATELPDLTGYDEAAIKSLPALLGTDAPVEGFRSDASVPLFISLLMVGLAPSFPPLQRLEERIRLAAHRLSGIPTRLLRGGQHLRQRPLRLGDGANTLMVAPADWNRLRAYGAAARGAGLADLDGFLDDMAKILALRAWVLDEKLPLAARDAQGAVAEVAKGLRGSVARLLFALDGLSGLGGASAEQTAAPDQLRLAWEAAERDADALAGDLCILTMLYLEHGVIPTEEDAARFGWGVAAEDDDAEQSQQRLLAERKLMRHVSGVARYLEGEHLGMLVWSRATFFALLIAFLFGLLFGTDPARNASESVSGGRPLVVAALYLTSAALIYALALLAAVSWSEALRQDGSWRNAFTDHWPRWTVQYLVLFAVAGLASLACVVGNNLVATMRIDGGVEAILRRPLEVLAGAVRFNGPLSLLGAALATLIVWAIDAWRAGSPGARALGLLPWIGLVVMTVVGAATRLMMSYAAASSGRPFNPLCDPARFPPDFGPAAFVGETAQIACAAQFWDAFSSGALAGLIGFVVCLVLRGTLRTEFTAPGRPVGSAPSSGPDAGRGVAPAGADAAEV